MNVLFTLFKVRQNHRFISSVLCTKPNFLEPSFTTMLIVWGGGASLVIKLVQERLRGRDLKEIRVIASFKGNFNELGVKFWKQTLRCG